MISKKNMLSFILVLSLFSTILSGCTGNAAQSVTFSQLLSQAAKYNGRTVTLEAFYFSGFEISALSASVGPFTSGSWRIVPTGTLIWVEGGISQELQNKLYTQTEPPAGYSEHLGKLKITGKFATGGKYGHLDAYQYQITITAAEMLDWSPPPAAASTLANGIIQFKVTDLSGMPLQGAKVVSEEQPAGQLKLSGLADEGGIVIFKDIKPGDYKFYVSRFGYNQHEIATTVNSGQTDNLNIQLASSVPPSITPAVSFLAITFTQLIAEPEKYNGQAISIEGFWFDGFEIVVLAERLEASSFAPGNVQPQGTLIWIKGGLPEDVRNQLYLQPDNPTGYPAHYAKVNLSGTLEYGGKYGHMNAYQYQLTIHAAKLIPPIP